MLPGQRVESVVEFEGRARAANFKGGGTEVRTWRRAIAACPLIARAAPALLGFALLVPSYGVAAENEDIATLKQMLRELKAENRKLSERLSALEGASAARRAAPAVPRGHPAPVAAAAPLEITPKPAPPAESQAAVLPAPDPSEAGERRPLAARVKDLEIGWAAQENATRQL